jgi:hypothetical protein
VKQQAAVAIRDIFMDPPQFKHVKMTGSILRHSIDLLPWGRGFDRLEVPSVASPSITTHGVARAGRGVIRAGHDHDGPPDLRSRQPLLSVPDAMLS